MIPVLLVASGVKTLRLGRRIVDLCLSEVGSTPDVIEHAASVIHQGAQKAGRDARDVETICIGPAIVIIDRFGDYREVVSSVAAGAGPTGVEFTLEDKQLPDEYHEPTGKLVDRYDSHEHVGIGGPDSNRDLPEELDLIDDRHTFSVSPGPLSARCRDVQRCVGGHTGQC